MPINVLWVEDEQKTLRYEQTLAKSKGWEICHVDNISSAMKKLSEKKFDLVVMDLILPCDEYALEHGEVDADIGINFLEWICDSTREGSLMSDILILVISAVISTDRVNKVVELLKNQGFYLNKPLTKGVFETKLTEINAKFCSRH